MLGTIYLYKLRYSKHFGQRAGSCWRLIFVYALMPWLHKYRIMARHEETTRVEGDDLEASEQLQFVSVRNFSLNGDNDAIGALWQMRANAVQPSDDFQRRRNQQLEEEVERLRVALADAKSLRNQDLVEENKRLRQALAAATGTTSQQEEQHDEQGDKKQDALATAQSLSELQPLAPPTEDQEHERATSDTPAIATTFSDMSGCSC